MSIVSKALLTLFIVFFTLATHAEPDNTRTLFAQAYKQQQALAAERKWQESLPYAKNAYELGLSLYGQNNINTASLAYNYGLNLLKLNDKKQAAKILKQTVGYYENVYGAKSVELTPVLIDLGRAKSTVTRLTPQRKQFKRALKISRQHYGENSVNHAQLLVEVGLSLATDSLSLSAKKYLYQGHEILLNTVGQNDTRTSLAAFHIGKFELAKKNYKLAAQYLNKTLATFSLPDQPSNIIEMSTHGFLVESYEKLNKPELATQHCLAIGRMTPVTPVQKYQPLVKITPKYPLAALQTRREGYVIVEYDVDEQGFVRDPQIIDSDQYIFNSTSLAAAKKFRYAPSFREGIAITTKGVRNKFTYTITK